MDENPEIAETIHDHAGSPKRSFRGIVRRQYAGSAVILIILVVFLLVPLWGPAVSISTLAYIVGICVVVTIVDSIAMYANWTCPRCGKFLGTRPFGRGVDPRIRHCAYCGYRLR